MLFRPDQARPFVSLVVDRRVNLSRDQRRFWQRDEYVQEAVSALMAEKYSKDPKVLRAIELGEDEEESGLIRFLNWLIENQDAIKAFIEMIMSLFNTSSGVNSTDVL